MNRSHCNKASRDGRLSRSRDFAPSPSLAPRLRSHFLVLAILAAATGAMAAGPVKMYKWVDEKGVVHYTDSLPPDAVDRGNAELSKEGLTIRKTEPNATPEQRRAREAEAERIKQDAKGLQETARLDRALLDSYTSEEDIDLAKKRALRTVEQSLESARGYIEQLTKRKEAMATAKVNPNDKNASAANERELARINADLDHQHEFVTRKQAEIASLTAKYDGDKERWRNAKARETRRSADAPAAKAANPTAANAQSGKPQK